MSAVKTIPPAPRGGEVAASFPKAGGELRLDFVANEVPKWEWLHELALGAETSLPVGDKAFGEELRVDAGWTMLRRGPAYLSLLGYAERPGELERQALGKDFDYGARLRLELRCASLLDLVKLDCKAE